MRPIAFGYPHASRLEIIVLALLAVAVVAAFYPLTQYFLAQDDFILIERATSDWSDALTSSLVRAPGHARPLTKGLFFVIAGHTFGLHAAAYHWFSVVLHITNIVLLYVLLCRLRIPVVAALSSVILFGLSVGNFHVIAWASCAQQLIGTAIVFLALILGIDAIEGRRRVWPSVLANVAALMCFEQAAGVTVVIALTVPLLRGRVATSRTLVAHGLVLVAYLGFFFVWKTLPVEGPYAMSGGANLFANLAVYLGWAVAAFVTLPDAMNATRPTLQPSHVVIAVMVVYLLARGRPRQAIFGVGAFVAMLLPTLPLQNHVYFLHLYAGAFGVAYLLAVVVVDLLAIPRFRAHERRHAMLGTWLVVATALSFHFVRANESIEMYGDSGFRRSFVLRRAEIARNAYDTVRYGPAVRSPRVIMAYGRAGGGENATWNKRNVIEALGGGSALRLFYGNPTLDVRFVDAISHVTAVDAAGADVFIYDDRGNCRRVSFPTKEEP